VSAFLDTNVLVYCTDAGAPAKRERARVLVARLSAAGEAVVSTQVLIELFHVLTRKQRMPPAAAQALVLACTAWPVIDSDLALVGAAIDQAIGRQLSIWDAMVVEAARRAEAQTLYSEDFGHGQRFGALAVVNPFLG
jgi:predicted nucleic acid-binding protein